MNTPASPPTDNRSIYAYSAEDFRDWTNSVTAGKCYCCGWPLKAVLFEGCIVWNCSQRPLKDAALERAHKQEGMLRQIRATFESPHEPRGKQTAAWLVEMAFDGRAHWWYGSDFIADANHAVRFARRQDAEQVILERGLVDAVATEHVWIDDMGASPPTKAAPAEPEGDDLVTECPNCSSYDVGTFRADQWFLYGQQQHRLRAENVEFFRCMSCDLEFTGEDGERKRKNAIGDFLNSRSPETKAGSQP